MFKGSLERWLLVFVALFLFHELFTAAVTIYLDKTKKTDVHYFIIQPVYPEKEEKKTQTEEQKWNPGQDMFGQWPDYQRLQTVGLFKVNSSIAVSDEGTNLPQGYGECKYCKGLYLMDKKTHQFLDHTIVMIPLDKNRTYYTCLENVVKLLQRLTTGEIIDKSAKL